MKDIKITQTDVSRSKERFFKECTLVPVEVAAEVLAVHPSTIYRYIQEGRISSYNGSRRRSKGVRILANELKEYVRSIKIDRSEMNI